MDNGIPDGLLTALQQGQQGDGVLTCIVAIGGACDLSKGGKQVAQTGELLPNRTGGDMARPADNKGNAMTTFPDVRFPAPVDVAGVVPLGDKFGEVGQGRTAVVAGEHYDGVVRDALFVQLGHESAHKVIYLEDKIGIGVQTGLALKLRGGHQRAVNGQGGIVKEEGLIAAGVLIHQGEDFGVHLGDDGSGVKAGLGGTVLHVEGLGRIMAGQTLHPGHVIRRGKHPVVFNVDEGRLVQ